MGNVYAWKIYSGDTMVGYCYLPSMEWFDYESTPFVTDCADIPACSADFARSLTTESAYRDAFQTMVSLLPVEYAKCLKNYTAYYNIGCDKPDGFESCKKD